MRRIYGRQVVEELLRTAPQAVAALVVTEAAEAAGIEDLLCLARERGLPIRVDSAQALRARAGTRGGVAVGADIRLAPGIDTRDLRAPAGGEAPPLVLALDGVTDPHNLGAILRSAAAFGVMAVLVPKDRAAPLNDAAVRASAGAVAHVPVMRVTNLARALRQLRDQGLWTVATGADAPMTLWECDLALPTALVLGSEGRGLRPGVARACDLVARLPLAGPVASLNVSVFAGAALAEAARQRSGCRGPGGPPSGPPCG